MNKVPFNRICEVAEISMQNLYDKIDFLHAQSLAFISDRERRILPNLGLDRLYLSTDRQDYFVNWTNTRDKRNVILKGVATVDKRSNYAFAMHVNYDSNLTPEFVRKSVDERGDDITDMPFRQFARIWLGADHQVAERKGRIPKDDPIPLGGLKLDIHQRYADTLEREEIEASNDPEDYSCLPKRGVQVHEEYTMYGHFFFLKRLLAHVGKLRFYLDQDPGLRAACLSAFCDDALSGRVDAFYVRVNKDLKRHQKEQLVAGLHRDLDEMRAKYPYMTDTDIRLKMITAKMKRLSPIGKWKDRWLEYPFPDMNEPEKGVCYLTDRNDLQKGKLARLYHMASLQAVDSYFNRIRSRVSPLDRSKKIEK